MTGLIAETKLELMVTGDQIARLESVKGTGTSDEAPQPHPIRTIW